MKNTKAIKQKPAKGKIRRWIDRQKIALKLWLYRRALLAALGFIALNAIDGYLTNSIHRAATAVGVAQSIESSPFLQPIVGSWGLSFKGVLGAGIIGILAYVKRFSPDRVTLWFLFGCLVMIGIVLWNMYAAGIIG